MTSAIVYRESDFYIKNITTFTQYVLNLTGKGVDNKLVTIMGEYHTYDINCNKDKTIMVADEYVIAQSKNTKTKIILEIGDKEDVLPTSNNMKIINKLETSNIDDIKNIETVYIDYRYKYLDPIYLYRLYEDLTGVSTLSYSIIKDKYIDPFNQKFHKFLDNDRKIVPYSKPHMDIVMDTYVSQLNISFNEILDKIQGWDSMPPQKVKFNNSRGVEEEEDIKIAILRDLQAVWARVTDFYVIRELFKIDDTQQYIILVGQSHYLNIIDYLNKVFLSPESYTLTKIGQDQNLYVIYRFFYGTKDDSCIKTLNTAYITSNLDDKRLRFVRPKIRK